MKSSLTLLVLVLLLVSISAGCAAGPNQFRNGDSTQRRCGFLAWALAGLYCAVRVRGSLFKSNLNFYELHNNGACTTSALVRPRLLLRWWRPRFGA